MAHVRQEPRLGLRRRLGLLLGLHQLELRHLDLGNIQYADLPEMPVVIEKGDDIHKGEYRVILPGRERELPLPAAGAFALGLLFDIPEELDMLLRKKTVHGSAHDLALVLYFQQLHRPVVAIRDDQRLRIEDEYPVERGIVDGIHELLLLEDGFLVIPVDPDYRKGEERGQQEGQQQVAVIEPAEHIGDMNLVVVLLRTLVETEQQT